MLTYTEISRNKLSSNLLLAGFFLFVILVGWGASAFYQQPLILVFAVVFSIGSSIASYYFSADIALAVSGAKPIDLQDSPELHRIVENLSITAGLPAPKIYLIDSPSMNAFATGRDPNHAAIAVTTGLLNRLDRTELEGVLAHELSHIGNYDIRFMTLVVVLVGMISLLADWLVRASLFSGNRDRDNRSPVFAVVGLLLIIISPIIATIIKLAISRRREYLADASGALLTRYPEGLASALEKISNDTQVLDTAHSATAHMFISNPLKDEDGEPSSLAKLFATHPPVTERIRRLREMGH